MSNYNIDIEANLKDGKTNLQHQLDNIKNLTLNIEDLNISRTAIESLKQQLAKQGVSLDVQLGNASSLQNQAKQSGREIGQSLQNEINKVIQKGDFNKIFKSDGNINNAAKEAEAYFKTLSSSATVLEKFGSNQNLTSFIVDCKNAQGAAESLKYALRSNEETGERWFEYVGGSFNDNGIIKQFEAITSKANSLQITLDKLKSKYTDLNSAKPIKDEFHLSSLEDQYNKAAKAIEVFKSADTSNRQSLLSNVNTEIASLENLISQYRNAEAVATSLRTKDFSTVKNIKSTELQEFIEKVKGSNVPMSRLQADLDVLSTSINNAFDSSSLTDFLNQFDIVKAKFNQFSTEIASANKNEKVEINVSELTSKLATLQKLSPEINNFKAQIAGVDVTIEDLLKDLSKVNSQGDFSVVNKKFKAFTNAAKSAGIAVSDLRGSINRPATDSEITKTLVRVQSLLVNNTKATKSARAQWAQFQAQLTSGSSLSKKELVEMNTTLDKTESKMRSLGKLGLSWSDSFKKGMGSFSTWLSATTVVMGAIQTIKKMGSAVYDVDTAMTNLYKVTDETDSKYNEFLSNTNKKAQELGRSVSSLVEQSANWAKLGYSIEDSAKLAEVSSIYANVGEVDDETAVKDIVTALKAFNQTADESITIVNSLNKLGNEFGTNAASLGEGLSNSASALALAGNDINQTLAMLTGGTEITQNASEMGNSLKVLSMRIRGMKGELQELGEEYENVESISKIQTQILNQTHGKVNIFDDLGNFRSTYDILKDISEVWSKIGQTDQAALLEVLAGKQRGNSVAALIQSFQSGQTQKALNASINSDGSAYEEQARWMDSLEAKTQQFKASFQELSQTVVDSDLMKWFVDFGTTGINALNGLASGLNSVGGILGALSGLLMNKMGIGEQ